MHALVTGAAGFIGYHLCQYLLARNYTVTGLDNFMTGSRQSVAELAKNPNFHLVEADVMALPGHLAGFDEIYNLACPASPPHYQKDPVRTLKTSVLGALQVLELARKTGARILQASTSEVYGDPQQHPQREDYVGHVNPIGPRACYDEGKRAAESLFFDYHRQHKISIKVARIFNTYGPYMDPNDGRVVSNFIVQAISGAPLTIYGDGRQTRSFCYIDDLVEGLFRLMQSDASITGPVNLGNPDEFTVLDLAEKVKQLTGISAPIIFKDKPADDPARRRPDIAKAKQLLDWQPQVKLETGLQRTIQYFQKIAAATPAKVKHG